MVIKIFIKLIILLYIIDSVNQNVKLKHLTVILLISSIFTCSTNQQMYVIIKPTLANKLYRSYVLICYTCVTLLKFNQYQFYNM